MDLIRANPETPTVQVGATKIDRRRWLMGGAALAALVGIPRSALAQVAQGSTITLTGKKVKVGFAFAGDELFSVSGSFTPDDTLGLVGNCKVVFPDGSRAVLKFSDTVSVACEASSLVASQDPWDATAVVVDLDGVEMSFDDYLHEVGADNSGNGSATLSDSSKPLVALSAVCVALESA